MCQKYVKDEKMVFVMHKNKMRVALLYFSDTHLRKLNEKKKQKS